MTETMGGDGGEIAPDTSQKINMRRVRNNLKFMKLNRVAEVVGIHRNTLKILCDDPNAVHKVSTVLKVQEFLDGLNE